MNAFTVAAATIQGTSFGSVGESSIDPGLETLIQGAGGGAYNTFAGTKQARPMASITTNDIKKHLDVVTADPLAMTTPAALYLQELAHKGVRTAGGAHLKATLNDGMILPRRIRAGHDSEASFQYDIVAIDDGTTPPLVIAKDQALPSVAGSITEKFFAGPAQLTVGGVTYDINAQGWELDFGIQEVILGANGEVYARFIGVQTQAPKLTIDTFDGELLADIGVVGAQATSITAFLRKATQYGTRVPETTEEHISFSIPTALITPDPAGGSHGSESPFKWNLDIPWNGIDSILTMDTTAAISAE